MPKKRFVFGVIDPVTIIGVLFLIITLGVGTYVVSDKEYNFNIFEKAGSCTNACLQSDFPELCGCTSRNISRAPAGSGGITREQVEDEIEDNQQQNNNNPPAQATTPPIGCNADGTIYQNGAIVVGGSSSSGYSRCEGNSWVPCPTCTITQLTTVPAYLQEQYNQAVQNILVNQEIVEQTAPRPNDLPVKLSAQQQEQKDICLLDGGMWSNQSMSCNYSTAQQLQEQVEVIQNNRSRGEARCSGSTLETWNGSTWDQQNCPNGCTNGGCIATIQSFTEINRDENGTTRNLTTIIRDQDSNVLNLNQIPVKYQNYYTVEKVDSGLIRDFTTIVRNQNTNDILNALTQSVHSNPNQPDQPIYSFADCSREGLTPEQTANCNKSLSQAYNAPIIGRYLQAYAPQNVQYTGNQFLGYDLYDPTKEQITSSVALGTAMTAGSAVITAGGGLASGGYALLTAGGSQALLAAGATTITQSIALGMAAMSTYQLGTTTDICITEGYTSNCRTQIAWTALSYANIGSSALQGAYQTSKFISNANTFINVVNVATDIADISQSCGDGEYASDFGCGAAIVGTVFDVGQSASDFGLIEAIVKNINLSNVANNPLAEVNFQSPNQLQLGLPDANIPRGINPNNITDVVQGPNGNFVVPNTSTTALAVAPHLNIAQADDVITATILDEIPATRPSAEQEIAGLLMAPEQPINVTKDFTKIETQKVPVEIGGEKLSIPQAEKKGFAGIIDEILNPPLAAFNPNFRWLMNIEPPKFIANIGDWASQILDPIANRLGLNIIFENLPFVDNSNIVKLPSGYPTVKIPSDKGLTILDSVSIPENNRHIRGYLMKDGTFVLTYDPNKDHTVLWNEYGLNSAYAIASFDANLVQIDSKFNINEIIPEMARRMLEGDISPDQIFSISGKYTGLGLGRYEDTIENLAKGLDQTKFKPLSLYNTNKIDFTNKLGDEFEVGPGDRLKSDESGRYLIVYIADNRVDLKYETGRIEQISLDQFRNKLDETEFSVYRMVEKPIYILPGGAYPIKRLLNDKTPFAGVIDINGKISVSDETLSHNAIQDNELLTDSETIGRITYDPEKNGDTIIISGSQDAVNRIIDQINAIQNDPSWFDTSIFQRFHKVKIYIFTEYGRIDIDTRLHQALNRIRTEVQIQKQNGVENSQIKTIIEQESKADTSQQSSNITLSPDTENLGNSFIVTDQYGKSSWTRDISQSDITPEFNQRLNELEYSIRYYSPDENKGIIDFYGYKKGALEGPDPIPVISGKSVGKGETRNAILITDHEKGISWVMYEYDRSAWDGAELQLEPIAKGIEIPIDNIEGDAYRYLPIENDLSLFPDELKKKYKIIEFISPFIDLVNPFDWIGRIAKSIEKAQWKHLGADMGELHNANVVFVVWDQKPKSDFTLPVIRLKPYMINDGKVFLPGISWARVETIEVRINDGGTINSNYNPIIPILFGNPYRPSISSEIFDGVKNWWDEKGNPVKWFGGGGDKGTNFGDDALLTVGGGTYKSLGGQKLVINPAKDTSLQEYLITARQYVEQNRTSSSISRVDLLNDYVHNSLRYAFPDRGDYYGPTILREEIYSQGSPAYLGQFIDNKTGVCREYAACLHVALADSGKPNYLTIGDVDSVEGVSANQEGGRHAWVEYIDSKTGEWMVADPTNGHVLPRDEAYKTIYVNVKNVEHEVFVWPEETPLIQRIFKYMTATPEGGTAKTTEKNPRGQTLVEFSTIMPAVLAVPTLGLYYIDQYFDWGIVDRIKNALSDNPTAKSLGVALDSGNFPILKPLAPILPLPDTNFENIDFITNY